MAVSRALLLGCAAVLAATAAGQGAPSTGALRGPSSAAAPVNSSAAALQAINDTLAEVAAANAAVYGAAGVPVPSAANLSSVEVKAEGVVDKLLGDFFASGEVGLTPRNFQPAGGNKFTLTVRAYEEAVRITSPRHYTGGKFEFRCRTASVMPGIITAVYMASGHGRTSDSALGQQDEIDLEWKGNTPMQVQSNVFVSGRDNALVEELGFDSSKVETDYAIEWNSEMVAFWVNGNLVRQIDLDRPLKPMQLQLAVWTTAGGWPGLIQWAGSPDWNSRGNQPATATFEILSVPHEN